MYLQGSFMCISFCVGVHSVCINVIFKKCYWINMISILRSYFREVGNSKLALMNEGHESPTLAWQQLWEAKRFIPNVLLARDSSTFKKVTGTTDSPLCLRSSSTCQNEAHHSLLICFQLVYHHIPLHFSLYVSASPHQNNPCVDGIKNSLESERILCCYFPGVLHCVEFPSRAL